MAFPDPLPSPTATDSHIQLRRLDILSDCRSRMESIDHAIDGLRLQSPDASALQSWDSALQDLLNAKVEVTLRLDQASSAYDIAGRIEGNTGPLLAEVKRLEGKLANVCAEFDVEA